jgi:hypothetical protein
LKNLEDVAIKAYEATFSEQKTANIENITHKVRRTSRQGLRFLIVEGYTFLEQNPEKNSVWGKMAKDGHKILWVIEDGDYIGQVRDGVYHDFRREY